MLSILQSLVQQHPTLTPIVAALVPPPSLQAYTSTLQSLEKKVTDAIPRGINLREEYIWGRVRTALEEYVAENRHYLSLFTPSSQEQPASFNENSHPSTVFAFLYTLTMSVRKVESLLPRSTIPTNASNSSETQYRINTSDPLSSSLIPLLINAWHVFVTRTSYQVNNEGKILSAETVRTSFRQLEELTGPSTSSLPVSFGFGASSFSAQPLMQTMGGNESMVRKHMEGIKERMTREIGWLAGIRPQQTPASSSQSGSSIQPDGFRRAKSTESMEEEL